VTPAAYCRTGRLVSRIDTAIHTSRMPSDTATV
jgi:hypothetical protein